MATIKLRDAIERRDGEAMVIEIDGKRELFMIVDYPFTQDELDADMEISDKHIFVLNRKVKFTDVTTVVNGKMINFSIKE